MNNKMVTKMKSALQYIIYKTKMFQQMQNAKHRPTIINPFNALAEEQRKARMEADQYRFFIKGGFITLEEAIKLYRWFDRDGEIRDKDGKTRIKLLRKLPGYAVKEVVDLEKLRFQPTILVNEIQKRMIERGVQQ